MQTLFRSALLAVALFLSFGSVRALADSAFAPAPATPVHMSGN